MVALVILGKACGGIDEHLSGGIALEVGADDRAEVLAHLGGNLHVEPGGLLKLEHIHAVDKALDLVAVLGEVEVQIPGEVLRLDGAGVEGDLDTAVVYLTGVDETVGVARVSMMWPCP